MYTLRKINQHSIKAIPVQSYDPEKIKGYDLIPKLYCAIFICANKESGKTNAIFKILKECTGKKTILYIITSTVYNDDNWRYIIKYFKKKGNTLMIATSLEAAGIPEKVKELEIEAMEELNLEDEKEEEKTSIEKKMILFNEPKEPKQRKEKKVAPEYIFVFDDMSTELRDKSISTLIKMHRHFKTKIICSSQYVNDLGKDARKNIDIWILFGGHSIDKLEEVYKNAGLHIPFDNFLTLYEDATAEPYSFLYVARNGNEFRKTFTMQYFRV